MRITRNSHQPARHLTFESITRREESRVRPAVTKRNAEALRAAYRHIRTEFPGRRQQGQAEQIRGNNNQRAGLVGRLDEGAIIINRAVRGRILD